MYDVKACDALSSTSPGRSTITRREAPSTKAHRDSLLRLCHSNPASDPEDVGRLDAHCPLRPRLIRWSAGGRARGCRPIQTQ